MGDPDRRGRPSPFLKASLGVHGVALASLIGSPQSWRLALSAIVGNHLVIGTAGMLPRCSWLGPNITRLPADKARGELVGLTFDDGPDPVITPAVLELLASAGARATFFCIGQRAEMHPDLVTEIRARGHGVENHTQTHPNSFALRRAPGLAREVLQAQNAIEDAGGGRPNFFRAPAGIQNPWLAAVLDSAGLSLVSWTRRGFDTVTRDARRVAARLVRGLRPADILLLHDGSSARDSGGRPVVLEALPRVLDEMCRNGLRSEALHAVLQPAHERLTAVSLPGTR
jgi:peptidoglycan/xylan/chitin deacetylase (PgdA/CDA1 family)